MLVAQGVSFAYASDAKRVLQGVSLEVAPGERVEIKAPSGTGKTTLCQILAGYLHPQGGVVTVDGVAIDAAAFQKQHRPNPVQLISQHPEYMLDPRLRIRDSLKEAGLVLPPMASAPSAFVAPAGFAGRTDSVASAVPAAPKHAATSAATAAEPSAGRLAPTSPVSEAQHLLDSLGVQPQWLARYPHELSGGELQRICIARALATNPRYLICDEISTMLDALTQARIWQCILAQASASNMGLVFVSHSPALSARIATRTFQL